MSFDWNHFVLDMETEMNVVLITLVVDHCKTVSYFVHEVCLAKLSVDVKAMLIVTHRMDCLN